MSVSSLATRALKLADKLSFLAPLLTRLVIGQAFILTGWGKWANFERTSSFFADLGLPFPVANAAFIASLELVGGICLIVGAGTRIIALLLSCTMMVALITADRESLVKNFASSITDVTPVVYLLFLIWLVLCGPGRVSIDGFLHREANWKAFANA
jgi:putative oxidoreductase